LRVGGLARSPALPPAGKVTSGLSPQPRHHREGHTPPVPRELWTMRPPAALPRRWQARKAPVLTLPMGAGEAPPAQIFIHHTAPPINTDAVASAISPNGVVNNTVTAGVPVTADPPRASRGNAITKRIVARGPRHGCRNFPLRVISLRHRMS